MRGMDRISKIAIEATEKPVVYDTVHRVISDSVTIEALKNAETFYNYAFDLRYKKMSKI